MFIRVRDRDTGHQYDVEETAFDEDLHLQVDPERFPPTSTPRPAKPYRDLGELTPDVELDEDAIAAPIEDPSEAEAETADPRLPVTRESAGSAAMRDGKVYIWESDDAVVLVDPDDAEQLLALDEFTVASDGEAEGEAAVAAPDIDKLLKADLVALAQRWELDDSGTVLELRERLHVHQAALTQPTDG